VIYVISNRNTKIVEVESLRIEMGGSVDGGGCYINCSFILTIHHTWCSWWIMLWNWSFLILLHLHLCILILISLSDWTMITLYLIRMLKWWRLNIWGLK